MYSDYKVQCGGWGPIRAGSLICKKNSDHKDIQSVQTMCLYNTQNSAIQYCVYTM